MSQDLKSLAVLPAQRRFGETSRRDTWWVTPVLVFLGLSAFIVYSTWAGFQNNYYLCDKSKNWSGQISHSNYLSPFYSPLIFAEGENIAHSWFGGKPSWWPVWLFFSPAFLILWGPAGFRLTCYYYRGAYYKALWGDPPSCAVGEPRKSYWGERFWPLFIMNIHRYFAYIAVIFLIFLAHDVWEALWFKDEAGNAHFGLGVGTFVLALNVILLGGYTFGCHSLRHVIGGRCDQLSKNPTRYKAYQCVSCLNRKHQLWAWMSLCWVGFSDVYVRLCSMGVWQDWRIF